MGIQPLWSGVRMSVTVVMSFCEFLQPQFQKSLDAV